MGIHYLLRITFHLNDKQKYNIKGENSDANLK